MCFRPATAATQKICPECEMINPAIAQKCIKCGAELPEDRVPCPNCGEMNAPGLTVCYECGAPLVSAPKVPEAPIAPKAPNA